MAFRKAWRKANVLNRSQLLTGGFQRSLQRTATSATLFQQHKVVENSVNDSRCSRTQPLVFGNRGHLGNQWPAFAFTCTFYYHAYAHMISRDGRFFTLFRYEIPHVTYRKFNTGISNKLVSQREGTIGRFWENYFWKCLLWLSYHSVYTDLFCILEMD